MRTRFIALPAIVALSLLTLVAAGCQQQTSVSAAAAPPMFTPIGPAPGFAPPLVVQTDPYAHDQVGLAQGRKLFVWYNCSGCHGGHGGGGMGPSLRDETWIYGSTDSEVFDSIAQGRGKGMPAWGLKIPEDQIWQLVAYIKSMRSPEEPDRPE